jgi:hypothetical protein
MECSEEILSVHVYRMYEVYELCLINRQFWFLFAAAFQTFIFIPYIFLAFLSFSHVVTFIFNLCKMCMPLNSVSHLTLDVKLMYSIYHPEKVLI